MRKRAKSSNDLISFFEPKKIKFGIVPEEHVDSDKVIALGKLFYCLLVNLIFILEFKIEILQNEIIELQNLMKNMRKVWTCSICYKENLPESIYILDKCEHKFCPQCLSSYIRTLVSEGQIDVPCPECRIQLEYHEIQTLMDDALKVKYESFSIEKAISGMNDIVYCPTADCSTAYVSKSF